MEHMRLVRSFAVLVAAAAAAPATASADVPWGASVPLDGISSATALLTTGIGGHVLVGTSSARSLASPTVVARVQRSGATTHVQSLDLAYARAATFRRAGVVVAGSRPGVTTRAAERAPVLVALGSIRGIHDLGAPRALAGTQGEWVLAVAGNPAGGTIALVTGSMYRTGRPRSTLWVRRGATFRRVLTIQTGIRSPETAVAVGSRGDVLVAWQGDRAVYARHIGSHGGVGARHRLGTGVQSALQARVDDDDRLEVAWESQRVGEGDAVTPAVVSYTSAAAGRSFARARTVGGSSLTGTGRYVMRPGVRLVATGPSRSLLAWTQYDGARFRVQVADVAAGRVSTPQTVSPPAEDCVLGDVASAPAAGDLVLWLTNTRGNDATGLQRVAAAVRRPGAAAFGAPELVSEAVAPGPGATAMTVPTAPHAAVDPRDGGDLAVWTTLDQHTMVAGRPGS